MAVVSVNLKSQESGVGDGGKLTATQVYIVEVEAGDTSETARTAAGIPQYGALFAPGSPMRVQSNRAVSHQDDLCTYLVTVEFAQKSGTSQQASENPLTQTPKYAYGGSGEEVDVFHDSSPKPQDWDEEENGKWLGKPIVTSAFEQFPSQPKRPRTRGTITITRNEAVYNDLAAETFKDTVNKSEVTIRGITYAAGTLRMGVISAEGPNTATFVNEENETVEVEYWTITYNIEKELRGWRLHLEDRGRYELAQDPNYPNDPLKVIQRRIVLPDGTTPTDEYPLDGKGHMRPEPVNQPAVLTFILDPEIEWTPLALA